MTDKEYLNSLKEIVEKHHCQYFRILKREENKELLEWIEQKTPLLKDPYYKISTKVNWILNGRTEFPRCKNPKCNKEMKQNVGICNRGYRDYCCTTCSNICSASKVEETKLKRYGDRYYVNREKGLQTTFERYGAYSNMQSEKGKQEYLEGLHKKYGDEFCNIFQVASIKKKCKQTKLERYGDENYNNRELYAETNLSRYGVVCTLQADFVREKSTQTLLKNFGVDHPSKSKEIQEKIFKHAGSKYRFDNRRFDSKEEVALYIWLTDNSVDFEYHNGNHFDYYTIEDNKTHRYFPDFLIEGKYVEIKGDHFFTKDGSDMINPYRKENDYIASAKFKCMLDNNVQILKSSSEFLVKCLDYTIAKYGEKFFDEIRIETKRKNPRR